MKQATMQEPQPCLQGEDRPRCGSWRDDARCLIRILMVHSVRRNGRMRYGPGSTRQRHDDRGSPSNDTRNIALAAVQAAENARSKPEIVGISRRPAVAASPGLHQRLQFWPQAQDAQGPHAI